MSKNTNFEYNIRKFNTATMDKTRSCIFIGGSGTGKSHAVTSILYHNRDIPVGIVMSGTEEGDPYWSRFIPDLFIYNQWEPQKLEEMIDIQKKKKRGIDTIDKEIEYCRKNNRPRDAEILQNRKQKEMNAMRKFVIIDDCMFQSGITRTETLRKLFMNGRHWNIFVMLTIQYCMGLDIALRGNAGYVFVCRENIISYRRKIFESFLGMLPNFQVFEKVMDSCTQNYELLVLDRTVKSTNPEDALFWYKAAANYTFKIGSDRLWQYHRDNYDTNHEDRLSKERKAKRSKGIVTKIN
tara:strand:+ start:1288 stop:2172 length:885 start_codon:yes stop_codon:yes gene_type:complete